MPVCVCECTHAQNVCVWGGDKKDTGKTSGTVKEKEHIFYRRKEKFCSPAKCNTNERESSRKVDI